MTLGTSAGYALYAAFEMAKAGDRPVTVGEVAGPYRIPPTALAKVFQQLVRAGLAVGTRGVGGGYRLARPRSAITVLDVVAAFEPPRPAGRDRWRAEPADGTGQARARTLHHLFDEVDQGARTTLASVTLETLVR